MDCACYESDKNSNNTEGEVDFALIYSKNEKKSISINYDVNVVHKYYATFLP